MAKRNNKSPKKKSKAKTTPKRKQKPRTDNKTRNHVKGSEGDIKLQTCICGDRRCKPITRAYIEVDKEHSCLTAKRRGGWRIVPSTTAPNGAKGKVMMAERKMIFQAILGETCAVPDCVKGKRFYMSNIHTPDKFLSSDVLEKKYIERNEVTPAEFDDFFVGKGFLRVKTNNIGGSQTTSKYFAGPVLSIDDAEDLFEDYKAHRAAQEKRQSLTPPRNSAVSSATPATPTTPPPRSNQDRPRPRPTERKKNRLESVFGQDPEQAASEYMKLQEQYNQKCQQLEELKATLEARDANNKMLQATILEQKQELRHSQGQIRDLKKQLALTKRLMKCLNAVTLTSDQWHDKNDDAAKYLFGIKSSWAETKIFLQACFPDDIDVNEYGGKTVSAFEQLLVALMRAKAGFEEKTLGYIIGRDDTSVNRYISRWLPKLGRIGRFLHRLPTDFTHDFVTETVAQQHQVEHGKTEGPNNCEYCLEHHIPLSIAVDISSLTPSLGSPFFFLLHQTSSPASQRSTHRLVSKRLGPS
mmetsp:Transcript_33508/g.67611  ORF Transcript_33508/g.67611 Transcript_33508/m.67611 type:complete len:525 (+) Transcript_33508:4947-6521(+)